METILRVLVMIFAFLPFRVFWCTLAGEWENLNLYGKFGARVTTNAASVAQQKTR